LAICCTKKEIQRERRERRESYVFYSKLDYTFPLTKMLMFRFIKEKRLIYFHAINSIQNSYCRPTWYKLKMQKS
jgi:hypothetical protein